MPLYIGTDPHLKDKDMEKDIIPMLKGVDFTDQMLQGPVYQLSGGWRIEPFSRPRAPPPPLGVGIGDLSNFLDPAPSHRTSPPIDATGHRLVSDKREPPASQIPHPSFRAESY